MKPITLRLNRNLRKSLLQGDPWVYRQALKAPPSGKKPTLCRVEDQKGEFIGWGMADPHSPLAVRMLSLEKKAPDQSYFENLLRSAWDHRSFIDRAKTNCFRFLNGEGDLTPGLVCDVYGDLAVLQFDGDGPYEYWDQEWLADWMLNNTRCESVYFKPRHDSKQKAQVWGRAEFQKPMEVLENELSFFVDVVDGQKTGFFLDQRDNRNYVRSISSNKSVLNLFSYTGGFSIYAGAGGALNVTSVDISQAALALAQKSWLANNLKPNHHITQCMDVFEEIQNSKSQYDIVICDPPSLAKSEKHKEQAIKKYVETFAGAAKKVSSGGHLVLSSCSSHISFNDFQAIVEASLSKSRKRGQVLRVSGQGADHPFPNACPHLRYLKFYDLRLY